MNTTNKHQLNIQCWPTKQEDFRDDLRGDENNMKADFLIQDAHILEPTAILVLSSLKKGAAKLAKEQ